MTIQDGSYKGIPFRRYIPVANPLSDCILVFLHGSSQYGNANGSQLNLMETNGYPKYAKAGTYEYPYQILAPQGPPGQGGATDYANIKKYLVDLVKQFNPRKKGLTGWSQGAETAGGWLTDSLNSGQTTSSYLQPEYWDFYIIFAGRPVGAVPNYCAHPDKPVRFVSGTNDTTVASYNINKVFRDKLNACPARTDKAWLDAIVGGDHPAAPDRGCRMTEDEYGVRTHQFVVEQFTPPITSIDLVGSIQISNGIAKGTGSDGSVFTWPVTKS